MLTEVQARRVEGLHGVGINVWDYGGDGPPLLLLHCTGTNARVWDPVVQHLKARFRCIAPDTRGHGDSDTPEDLDLYEWRYSGSDTLGVIEAFGLDTPLFACGHSAGAAHICYAELERPGTFTRPVLIDPIIGPANFFPTPNPLAEGARRRRNEFESVTSAHARFGSKPPMSEWDPAALDAYVRYAIEEQPDGTAVLKCPGPIEAAVYDRGGSPDVFERLGSLTFEPLLITSADSDVKALAHKQRDRFPNATFRELAQGSHFIPQEQAETVAEMILDWFSAKD